SFRDDSPICEKDEGDWYGVDVTDIVREWLAGDSPNYGFALAGTETGEVTSFWSAYGDDEANYPRLSVRYYGSAPAEKYGKYGYAEQPEEAGNCLSYALRDTDAIYADALFDTADADEFEKLYVAGLGGAMAYFEDTLFNYIETHKEALGIESWRRLSGFDDAIDPEREYMIAMKIASRPGDSDAAADATAAGIDYHFRVRLDDGRWAEKVPHTVSRVTPGSNAAFDTGKYPWDAVFQWGYPKWTDHYDSPALYFAITKNTDTFTAHMH
ncbi:MAG: DNRLRE domain-containing protein, partial [Clostridiales Family XIII bacterium]|nr:DNRLRE domain-containing protein [Clostridiales Family XIII bacterium]